MASDSAASAAAHSAGPERFEALARLLTLLESARPVDIPEVLAALPEGDLALGVEAVRGWLALPVREYIITEGPTSARVALARRAVLGGGPAPVNTVNRLLALYDPDVDAVFFDLDLFLAPVRRAREIVVRDRKGPDGRAVIPPAVAHVNYYEGTVPELFADLDLTPGRPSAAIAYSAFNSTVFTPANILLALAPPDVAARALGTKRMKETVTAAAGEVPLCRALVEYIVERGNVPQRGNLAANEAAPDSILLRLLEKPRNDEVRASIRERELVDPEIGKAAFAGVPRGRQLLDWIVDNAAYDPAMALNAIRGTSDDPAWVFDAMRAALNEFREEGQAAAYVLLAEVVGVESVWALELDRAGSLDYMADQVRESMATGDAAPLIAEAREHPLSDTLAAYYAEPLRSEAVLDAPLFDPKMQLVRTRLDGRPDRWLALAGKFRERPEATDADLVGEFPALG